MQRQDLVGTVDRWLTEPDLVPPAGCFLESPDGTAETREDSGHFEIAPTGSDLIDGESQRYAVGEGDERRGLQPIVRRPHATRAETRAVPARTTSRTPPRGTLIVWKRSVAQECADVPHETVPFEVCVVNVPESPETQNPIANHIALKTPGIDETSYGTPAVIRTEPTLNDPSSWLLSAVDEKDFGSLPREERVRVGLKSVVTPTGGPISIEKLRERQDIIGRRCAEHSVPQDTPAVVIPFPTAERRRRTLLATIAGGGFAAAAAVLIALSLSAIERTSVPKAAATTAVGSIETPAPVAPVHPSEVPEAEALAESFVTSPTADLGAPKFEHSNLVRPPVRNTPPNQGTTKKDRYGIQPSGHSPIMAHAVDDDRSIGPVPKAGRGSPKVLLTNRGEPPRVPMSRGEPIHVGPN